jgi:uncharacterized protein YjbI with pentapeptide repeats
VHIDGDFTGVDWYGREATTRGAVFEECDFSGAKLNVSAHERSAFLRCRFHRASLFDATLDGCKLTGSEFAAATVFPITVRGGDWTYVSLRGARLAGADLTGLNLAYADLTEADLRKTVLHKADLSHARLDKARLNEADLREARLDGVDTRTLELSDVRVTMLQAVVFAQHRGAIVEV